MIWTVLILLIGITSLFLPITSINAEMFFVLEGKVTDKKNQPIAYANVYFTDSIEGITTNEKGYCIIDAITITGIGAYPKLPWKLKI